MEICVAAFPVPGCGSIKIDSFFCWVPVCLEDWLLEVNISVFLFIGLIYWLAVRAQRAQRAPVPPHPWHRTPSQPPVPPVRCHSPAQPWALQSQVCSCPQSCSLPLSHTLGVPWGVPSLSHSLDGAEAGPGWCFMQFYCGKAGSGFSSSTVL